MNQVNNSETQQKSITDAVLEINAIRDQCAVFGFNDHELSTLANLIIAVQNSQKTPAEGITEAQKIIASKQDYH